MPQTPAGPDDAHAVRRSPSRRLGTGWPTFPSPFEEGTRRILLSGDWHGTVAWGLCVIAHARDLGASTAVVLGDHGVLWPGDKGAVRRLNAAAARARVRLVLVPGNHDWHDRLDAVPVGPDGFARLEEWIWHAPRPTRWQVAGVRFAALGGAYSIDRARRVEGVSWWRNELVTSEHVEALGSDPVDVLLTHESPVLDHLHQGLHLDARATAISDRQRELIAEAANNTRPRLLVHGHWHQRANGRMRYPDGSGAIVVSLDKQWSEGNWVVLDVPDLVLHDPRQGPVPPLPQV